MYLYAYDMHVHTVSASKCARSRGGDMARALFEKGYAGIVITDHFFNGYTCVPEDLPWKERVEWFCSGYEEAKAEGDRIGLDVFFGWEYCLNGSEFLTYGLDKNWLLSHEEVLTLPIRRYFDLVHESGGFLSHAHPFRKRADIPPVQLFPDYMDAVEVINGGNAKPEFDAEAFEYADVHALLYTAGSDSHSVSALKGGGCALPERARTLDALLNQIRGGQAEVFSGMPLEAEKERGDGI